MTGSNPKLDASLAQACVVLGLAPPFSPEQAKTRYRELAKIYHPDVGAAKNTQRFADISKSYELISEHAQRLSAVKLGFHTDANASAAQLSDALRQLHEARTKNVTTEKKLQQMTEESKALRSYVQENRAFSKRGMAGTILFIVSGIVLGFLAGMLWTTPATTWPLTGATAQAIQTQTTNTVHQLPLQGAPGYTVEVRTSGSAMLDLLYKSPTIELQKRNAVLATSPTITLRNLPEIEVTLTPPPAPNPTPQPPPLPAPTPPPLPPIKPETSPANLPANTNAVQSSPVGQPQPVTTPAVQSLQTTATAASLSKD